MIPAVILGVAVICTGSYQGRYVAASHSMRLDPLTCQTIRAAPAVRRDIFDVADAIFGVAHEAGHGHDPSPLVNCGVAGPCEAFADCYGAGHMRQVGRLLGFPAKVVTRAIRVARAWTPSIGYAAIPMSCWR